MIKANQYKLSWEHFNDINSDKRNAFEKLCRSLFMRTKVSESEVLHSEPNNPGVEVAPVFSKEVQEKVSFQAKYFDSAVDYNQIKKSIMMAIEHYRGDLSKIYLYVNKDITTMSQSYKTIEKMASEVGIDIIPVTGQSILDEAMNYPTILACYFGLDYLDKDWFRRNLEISLDNLGRRYNNLFNIDTDAQKKLSLFLREKSSIEQINGKKEQAIINLKELSWKCDDKYKKIIGMLIDSIKNICDINSNDIEDSFIWEDVFKEKNNDEINILTRREKEIKKVLKRDKISSKVYDELERELGIIRRIRIIINGISLSNQEKNLIKSKSLIITGEMGVGKSQLLATSAQRIINVNREVIFLLGHTFISEETIEKQMLSLLEGISYEETLESLLAIMDEKAYLKKESSVIFIDAINESRYKDIWKVGINRIISLIEKYSNIRLVLSLRSGYEQLVLSEKIVSDIKNEKIASIEHKGLIDDSPKRIFEFLSSYGVPCSPEFYLQNEMSNPLFLTWFGETYVGKEQDLYSLIELIIKKADKEASKAAGYSEPIGMLRDLLEECADFAVSEPITKKTLLKLESWGLYGVVNKIAYLKALERAGVFTTYVLKHEEYYNFGYNLLEDYLIASCIIKKNNSKESIEQCSLKEVLGVDENGEINKFENASIFAMTLALFAKEHGEECFGIIDNIKGDWEKTIILEKYIKTFSWRNPSISLEELWAIIKKNSVGIRCVWDLFIECATKEKSIFNAEGLTKVLQQYPLNIRDYLWTICINDLTENDRIVNIVHYIEAGNELKGLSEKRIILLLTLFAWMLSSTNRMLRDNVSKAMVELLKRNIKVCCTLLEGFKDVNDPYIIQRLYGVFWGAVMKRDKPSEEDFKNLALMVYSEVFEKEMVYPDILLRDYARLIVERFLYEYPSNKLFDVEKLRPPYKSELIPKCKTVDYCDEKYNIDGLWELLQSIKFDLDVKGVGMYGDFGRYIFQSALNEFVNVDVTNVYYYSIQFILSELGYSGSLFGDYDIKMLKYDRHFLKCTERIGKKYEWIAMFNILARLSDTNKVKGYNREKCEEFSGPWSPYVRDFDPTLNSMFEFDRLELPYFADESLIKSEFIIGDACDKDIKKWLRCDDQLFEQLPNRFIRRDKDGVEWISMYLYQKKEKKPTGQDIQFLSFARGEQHIWSISSLHIVDESQDRSFDDLEKTLFAWKNSGTDSMRDSYSLFSREYAWSPGYEYEFSKKYDDEDETTNIRNAAVNAMWECQYDASQEEASSFYIPAGEIINTLKLYQKDIDGVFYYDGKVGAIDTRIIGSVHSELLIRRELLDLFVEKAKVTLFWSVIGEKQFFLGGMGQEYQRREGVFFYEKNGIKGEMRISEDL